ncbi:probable E3 ubiquitin-protein ligase makorin-1 [Colius striatus]|uniref:probable E3 ubiquitin-protein ligase makorin-1 n=1 Tax=Colius striatus TaxID=57412 RepID=UPI002B1D9206|nr:probable E3 ubiquitin-protein ligase makorin-1 [Colius striatus]
MEPGSLLASGALRAQGGCQRPLCRNFARGFCRWGQSCHFSHDRRSAQVCRYFQKGFCSHGEQCSYLHVQEELVGPCHGPVPAVGRRCWGAEPGRVPAAGAGGWRGARRGSAHPVPSGTHAASRCPGAGAEEEHEDSNVPGPRKAPCGTISAESGPARARGASGCQHTGLGLDPNPPEVVMDTGPRADPAEAPPVPAPAAAPGPGAALRAQSQPVACGICMEHVAQKALPEERLFGILPNCSHVFCLGCIRTWRRCRGFQSNVLKACPECRVSSSYYIPHKHWVSDAQEKEKLIEDFKARMGKIRCKFFVQNHGRCPFKSDCIYLHEPRDGRAAQRPAPRQRPPSALGFSLPPSESSAKEDEELCMLEWALRMAQMEMDFQFLSCGHEMLFTSSSDSD